MASIHVPSATVCTTVTHGRQYITQPVFECTACNQIVCAACVKRCHANHSTRPRGVANAYCDCGVSQYCFANTPPAATSTATSTPITTSTSPSTSASPSLPQSQPHICTYIQHGAKHYIQPLYECVTCQLTGGSCVCKACVQRCHAGHEVRFKSTNRAGYCDCGSANPSRCASTVPAPPTLASKLDRLCTLSLSGTSYMPQPAYACVDCSVSGTSICCSTCAIVCHSHAATGGTNARLIAASANAYCDCCSTSTSGCRAIPNPWAGPWKHVMKIDVNEMKEPSPTSSSSSSKQAAPMPTSTKEAAPMPKASPPMPSSKVADLLTECGLAEYIPIFASNEIDLDTLKILDDESLSMLIPKLGPRAKLRAAIASLSQPATTAAASTPTLPPGHVIYKQLLMTVSKDQKITERDLELLQRMRTDYSLSIADHLQIMHDCGISQEQFEAYKAAAAAEAKAAVSSPPPEERATCVVCLDEPANHCVVPCGHVVLCGTCAPSFKPGTATCPSCRASIEKILKIFVS